MQQTLNLHQSPNTSWSKTHQGLGGDYLDIPAVYEKGNRSDEYFERFFGEYNEVGATNSVRNTIPSTYNTTQPSCPHDTKLSYDFILIEDEEGVSNEPLTKHSDLATHFTYESSSYEPALYQPHSYAGEASPFAPNI